MSQAFESVYLAFRDWKHEFLLSICAVLGLASMLAPVLVLQGIKNGVIDGMRSRLLEDPSVLIITPKSDDGHYDRDFIASLAQLPGARFAIGRTRETATDMTLFNPDRNIHASIAFEPAAEGEPVLANNGIKAPKNAKEPQIVLSQPAARALGAATGDILEARLGRRTPQGKLESVTVPLTVAAVLPITAADRRMAFAPLEFLEDAENYRDYLAVPARDFSGNPNPGRREYASFRLYAANLDAVGSLADYLAAKNIETITRAREIASIRNLEAAINQVILIISLAVGAGFTAFTLSSAQSAASRKTRMLGMLRLLGFKRFALLLYPLAQCLLTACAGIVLSFGLYFGASLAVVAAFASQGGISCHLGLADICLTVLAVLALSALASARAAWQASNVEPSCALREE